MDAIEKFFASEAFFPVLVVLLSLLLLTLLWITLSNRKKSRNMVPQNSVVDEESTIKIIQDENQNVVAPNNGVPTYTMNAPQVENPVEVQVVEEVKETTEAALPEMPSIPEVNETPVELDIQNIEPVQEVGEVVNIDNPVENNVTSPIDVSEENDAFAVTMDEVQALTSDVGESVQVLPGMEFPDAFGGLPTDDITINENVEVESPVGYNGEKTEVFEFPSFGEEINNLEADTAKGLAASQSIESDVIEAANRYIRSVMSK